MARFGWLPFSRKGMENNRAGSVVIGLSGRHHVKGTRFIITGTPTDDEVILFRDVSGWTFPILSGDAYFKAIPIGLRIPLDVPGEQQASTHIRMIEI